jgi:hypothetical protein
MVRSGLLELERSQRVSPHHPKGRRGQRDLSTVPLWADHLA